MNKDSQQPNRILAIDPTPRGFGYAVLEGPMSLVDWGVKEAKINKNDQCLNLITVLIKQYQPDVMVVEDCTGQGSRRSIRIVALIDRIIKLADKKGLKIRSFSRSMVRDAFSEVQAHTKHQIAEAIALRFPELAPRLPQFRKSWMSEDYRMSIFDAMAIALTYYYFEI